MRVGVSRRLILLGGPNGAGKTTAAMRLLPDFLSLRDYVNADAIASGLSAFAPEKVARGAGRLMLRRIEELAEQGSDFAFETTLASRTFAPFLRRCGGRGYEVTVIYLWLPSADLAVERVATRVRAGGHSVPEEVIRRRYARGWRNFLDLYRPLATRWQVYDNSLAREVLVAEGEMGSSARVATPERWAMIATGPQAP